MKIYNIIQPETERECFFFPLLFRIKRMLLNENLTKKQQKKTKQSIHNQIFAKLITKVGKGGGGGGVGGGHGFMLSSDASQRHFHFNFHFHSPRSLEKAQSGWVEGERRGH